MTMIPANRLWWAAALLGFSLFLYFWGLGRIPFYTKGEPREATEVWEEIHAGEWILPLRNGHELPSKPPLFHWLGGLTALATGKVDEFSVRFPSALLATATVFLVFWAGARRWGTAAGVYAGFMLATNFEWIRAATTARVDMTLTAFLVGAFVAFDVIQSAPKPSPRALLAFYVCMGLAALGKGPVGILLPALVVVTTLAFRRDFGRLRQMHLVTGGVLTLLIAGSWYALAIARGGEAFVKKQLLVENLLRFVAAESSGAGHSHPFYYMIGGFFTGFAPWSFLVFPLGAYLYQNRQRLVALGYLYPLVWFGVVFSFYSLSASKRTVYLLPLYPAATLLLGAWWSRLTTEKSSMPSAAVRLLQLTGAVMAILVLIAICILLAYGFGAKPLDALRPLLHPKDQANLPLLQEILRARYSILLVWASVLVPVVGLFALSVHRQHWASVFASLVVFVASTMAVVNGVIHPELAWRRTFKPFLVVVRGVLNDQDDLSFYRTFDYGAVFYSRRHIPSLRNLNVPPGATGRRSYVLLWESVWDRLDPDQRGRLQFLHKSEGTGPKGRDPLVFALLKPEEPRQAGDEPGTPAASDVKTGSLSR